MVFSIVPVHVELRNPCRHSAGSPHSGDNRKFFAVFSHCQVACRATATTDMIAVAGFQQFVQPAGMVLGVYAVMATFIGAVAYLHTSVPCLHTDPRVQEVLELIREDELINSRRPPFRLGRSKDAGVVSADLRVGSSQDVVVELLRSTSLTHSPPGSTKCDPEPVHLGNPGQN